MKSWSPDQLRQLRQSAIEWFRKFGRSLPWRETHDPYRIWVSEIMLQQTLVATVIPYYERFLAEFPTVTDLAAADEDRVLFHWAGLGYYRRARQLHAAAKTIVEKHSGVFPKSFEEVLALPGIGRYTAGAICSFAYDFPTPIVEANTQRLYARLLHWKDPLSMSTSQEALWNFAESILPEQSHESRRGVGKSKDRLRLSSEASLDNSPYASGSGEINQAVMEIGSQVCLPKNPLCDACPLSSLCPTFQTQEQHLVPAPKPPKQYEDRVEVALLVRDKADRYLMRRCGPEERWAGLWDFPRFDVTASALNEDSSTVGAPEGHEPSDGEDAIGHLESAAKQFKEKAGRKLRIGWEILSLKHGVTRYRITLRCYAAQVDDTKRGLEGSFEWVSQEKIPELALNSTAKKISKELNSIRKK